MHERYCQFYCEENIWHLAERAAAGALVALITNRARQVAIWQQRAADGPDEPVVWDYHVVLFEPALVGWVARDLDSLLGPQVPAVHYLEASFPPDDRVPERYAPVFRVMGATTYRRELSSDRSHMQGPGGTWHAPPPSWPPIFQPARGNTFLEMLDLRHPKPGEVVGLASMIARVSAPVAG